MNRNRNRAPATRDGSRPHFLELMDSDRPACFAQFYEHAWKLLVTYPPRRLRDSSPEKIEEVVSETIYSCCVDRAGELTFPKLRTFQSRGPGAFDKWLFRVAERIFLDMRRKRWREEPYPRLPDEPDGGNAFLDSRASHDPPIPESARMREQLRLVLCAVEALGDTCRILLQATAEGMRPRDLTAMLGADDTENKRISGQIQECRRRLWRALKKQGFEW